MNEHAVSARDLAWMSLRDLSARYLELLDMSARLRLVGETIDTGRALERLAVSEAISRYVNDGRHVDILASLNAGASWREVADVLDAPERHCETSFGRGSGVSGSSTTRCGSRSPDPRPSA